MASVAEILKIAQGEVGVKEEPADSNRVRYNTWYYGREVSGAAYPWCMAFVQWVFHQADAAALLPARTVSCGALMKAAQGAGLWVKSGYRPGDIVIYDFAGAGKGTDHTGIVESTTAEGLVALEGNTGVGNDANGGSVMRRTRPLKFITGAVRPQYVEGKATPPTSAASAAKPTAPQQDNVPAAYAAEAVAWARQAGILLGDAAGDFKLRDTVTREQLIVFLYRAMAKKDGEEPNKL